MASQQDFIKGWPHPSLLERQELKSALAESFSKAINNNIASALNYGTKAQGAHMRGQPDFIQALSKFLSVEYGKDVDPATLMATGGSSMGTDISCRIHTSHGDVVVCEAPTYFLAHKMFRERGLILKEVPIENDGMNLDELEKIVTEMKGKVTLVYCVPVHHNPTGITMSNQKRERLMGMARKYKFKVIADEAYQLLNFESSGVLPMYYHDDPNDPRVLSVGTFSKLIGPGLKVGWVQAHPSLLKPMYDIGFIDSGNNPVIFHSAGIADFVESGKLKSHIEHVSTDLSRKCKVLCEELRKGGYEFVEPKGGYFVWVKSKGKMTGRSGKGMSIDPALFNDYMRLCFAWLDDDQIREGIDFIKEPPTKKAKVA